MGYIFYIMGKSSSGKDTIYKRIIDMDELNLKTIIGYTTRPMRQGENEGTEYHFVDTDTYDSMKREGKIIENRDYNTVYGIWSYFTADDGQINLHENNYLLIGTLESYEKIRNYYGKEKLVPIYIEVEDGERLKRAIKREESQENPKYEEMCRRFLADSKDFSEENLNRCGIIRRYKNVDMDDCIGEICETIISKIRS